MLRVPSGCHAFEEVTSGGCVHDERPACVALVGVRRRGVMRAGRRLHGACRSGRVSCHARQWVERHQGRVDTRGSCCFKVILVSCTPRGLLYAL
ncbi:hypothetical protein Pmani_035813 [Petrolisthes manimaculis]|nr:hypothetical protein Pmani_035813 [Petrolisthes manimaculis]